MYNPQHVDILFYSCFSFKTVAMYYKMSDVIQAIATLSIGLFKFVTYKLHDELNPIIFNKQIDSSNRMMVQITSNQSPLLV